MMRTANRTIERWAPEATAARHGSLRNLGFVDRTVSPWLETAQRSASLRMFSQMNRGVGEREGMAVSWVFPRPWYQDELDWMAAARQMSMPGAHTQGQQQMLTTRGTYMAPSSPRETVVPQAMYEFVAPSLSIARPQVADRVTAERMYSPLVPFAAAQAAQLMSRAVAPLVGDEGAPRMSPGLRSVLTAMLERSARAPQVTEAPPATRSSSYAPELVTPPAPRPSVESPAEQSVLETRATQVIAEARAQHARVAELQRVAQQTAQREYQVQQAADVAQAQARAATVAQSAHAAPVAPSESIGQLDASVEQKRIEARIAERMAERERSRATTETAQAQSAASAASSAQAQAQAAQAQTAQKQAEARAAQTERVVAAQRAQAATSARLHESARAAATADARAAQAEAARAQASAAQSAAAQAQAVAAARAAETPPAERPVPPEIAAALAALPPALAGYIGRRPDRAVQAISEVSNALRAVELIAHAAARGTSVEPTRGPRLAMPAGLGGLVATIERATPVHAIAPRAMSQAAAMAAGGTVAGGAMGIAGAATPATYAVGGAPASARTVRVPAMSWLAAPGVASVGAGSPAAIHQAASATPAGLSHVAWADRWLARFAGARPRSLDAMTVAAAPRELQMSALALAASAPGTTYVSNVFDVPGAAAQARPSGTPQASGLRPQASGQEMRRIDAPAMTQGEPQKVMRFADDAETPDDVFAAISAAAAGSRPTARAAKVAGIAPPAAIDSVSAPAGEPRETFADFVASAPPAAPGAGMSAQLASSPFAPALHHLLALPAMPSFDVRALFGGGLAATYLAGLIAPETHEVSVAPQVPSWATWGDERVAATQAMLGQSAESHGRAIADFDGSLVAPTPEGFIVERQAAEAEPYAQSAPSVPAPSYDSAIAGSSAAPVAGMDAAAAAAAIGQLTTLRSALLSWEVEQRTYGGGQIDTMITPPSMTALPAHSVPVAQSMIEALRMPMLGDTFSPTAFTMDAPNVTEAAEAAGIAVTAPGMIADRAQAWSIAQERSSSDLAFDFVPPELVLAARVYGLGPAEAAQAARLAVAGPGQLSAMAGAVDRTFVQMLAMERERDRGERGGAPALRADAAAGLRPQASGLRPQISESTLADAAPGMTSLVAPTAAGTADPSVSASEARGPRPEARGLLAAGAAGTTAASFGVEKRAPRGAFLWPSATVSALGLQAPTPDGEQAMSVAALELLAAQTVAELGTYASIGDKADPLADAIDGGLAAGTGTTPRIGAVGTGTMPRMGAASAQAAAAGEDEIVSTTAAMVSSSRRAKFEALYLALGQSPTGRQWSPAARAARALALAGRGEETVSARDRAAIAWDVLPAVYAAAEYAEPGARGTSELGTRGAPDMDMIAAGGADAGFSYGGAGFAGVAGGGALSTGAASARAAQRRAELREAGFVEMRPGLAPLSSRAGEALGSYVTTQPTAKGESSSSTREPQGALSRVPTAAPELVRTGRPSARHGGGEVEIPAWFEAAARKMFAEKGGASGVAGDISLAELTLVQSAPSSAIAASSRALPSAMPQPPANQHDERPHDHKEEHRIDVEKVANDVYRHIQSLMDSARARNGEPYL